jgi:hypothetical protein
MSTEIFTVDKFVVPAHAREEFLGKVHATHMLFSGLSLALCEMPSWNNRRRQANSFVTIVEWENSGATDGARKAVAASHQKINFDAQAMISRPGIRADIANYKRVEQAMAAE